METLPPSNLGEENLSTPSLMRLEDLYGMFPTVTSIPTWTPQKFQQSFAIDTTNLLFYFYDFTNTTWRSTGYTTFNVTAQPPLTGAVILAAGTNVTLSQSGQTITVSVSSPS